MANALIDSDIYIDFLQSGRFYAEIARLYAERTPEIYFSSVVIEELLAGAVSPDERKNVELLYTSFERAKRVIAPSPTNWRDTGNLLARIFREQPSSRAKLPHLVADCLIALSARTIGAIVHTRNRSDFELIRRFRHFSLVVLE
jgi:predicted nucleic acid-binding protein